MSEKGPVRILVCERGFVLVGRVRPHADFLFLTVDDCHTVRRWGTDAGLGQLAREGPRPDTVLDSEGDGVEVRKTAIYRVIPCDEIKWRNLKSPSV